MGKKKKHKHKGLRLIYVICAIIVFFAGLYYENGYRDFNKFAEDIKNNVLGALNNITENVSKTNQEENKKTTPTSTKIYKKVNGNLEMHIIDVGQRR